MIKVLSYYASANIGDSRSSKLLKGYLETITDKEVVLYGYGNCDARDDVDKLCEDADAIVIGTGGVFHNYIHNEILWFSDPELYKYITCPVIMMSSGFNRDYTTKSQSNRWKEIISAKLERADLIGMRTYGDKQMALSLGSCASKTYCCPDPLTFIGTRNNNYTMNKVGIPLYLYDESLLPRITSFIKSRGYDPHFIDHDASNFCFSDYSDYDFIVTNRFHGQVLSYSFGKPCFSIESNIRHRFIRQMLYPNFLRNYVDYHLLDEELNDNFSNFVFNKENMRDYAILEYFKLKNMFSEFLLNVEKLI